MWLHYIWYQIKIRSQINTVPTPTVAWTRAWLIQRGGGDMGQKENFTPHTICQKKKIPAPNLDQMWSGPSKHSGHFGGWGVVGVKGCSCAPPVVMQVWTGTGTTPDHTTLNQGTIKVQSVDVTAHCDKRVNSQYFAYPCCQRLHWFSLMDQLGFALELHIRKYLE